jgi:hypothetical protein
MNEKDEALRILEFTPADSVAYVKAVAKVFTLEGLKESFHPDTPFYDYRDAKGKPLYTNREAELRDILMTTGSLYGEWAKKEDCWKAVSEQKFSLKIQNIKADLATEDSLKRRQILTDEEASEMIIEQKEEYLRGISAKIWNDIDNWGRVTGKLTSHQRTIVYNIATKIKSNRPFLESELQHGPEIIEIVMDHAPEFFEIADENLIELSSNIVTENGVQITLEDVKNLVKWDKKHRRLKPHHYLYMRDIAEGRRPMSEQNLKIIQTNIDRLKNYGFEL